MNQLWLQIDIAQAAAELRATARGSRGEELPPHLLGLLFREGLRLLQVGFTALAGHLGAVDAGDTP